MSNKVPYYPKAGSRQWKPTITYAVRLAQRSRGFCLGCGEPTAGAIEPDAQRYTCAWCARDKVYAADELLLMNLVG